MRIILKAIQGSEQRTVPGFFPFAERSSAHGFGEIRRRDPESRIYPEQREWAQKDGMAWRDTVGPSMRADCIDSTYDPDYLQAAAQISG
jgi:hypothetical protein